MIDITMTAALRANILVKTLTSIRKNLEYSGGFRLIVDVAPVPLEKQSKDYIVRKQHEIVEIAQCYFPRCSTRCLFDSPQADAVRWTWAHATSEFVLQWEDDWVLEKNINLQDVVDHFEPDMAIMCFDRHGKSVRTYPGYQDQVEQHSKQVWYRVRGKSLGGPPALMRNQYMQQVVPLIEENRCLDTMSHDPVVEKLLSKWKIGIYLGEDGKGNLVQDIGKEWKRDQGFVMKKNTPRGVTWYKK